MTLTRRVGALRFGTRARRARRLIRVVARGDVGALRTFGWAARSLRSVRRQLAGGGIADVRLTPPPAVGRTARSSVAAALRWRKATCLEGSLVRQRFDGAAGRNRDLIIGVSTPANGFRAHAWLAGDRQPDPELHEIRRFAPAD